jgi:hypothetical protein
VKKKKKKSVWALTWRPLIIESMSMYRHVRNRLVERDTIISIDDVYAFLKEEKKNTNRKSNKLEKCER